MREGFPWRNDIIGFHTTACLACCRELMEVEVDYPVLGPRDLDAHPLGIDAGRLDRAAESEQVLECGEILRRRRDHTTFALHLRPF